MKIESDEKKSDTGEALKQEEKPSYSRWGVFAKWILSIFVLLLLSLADGMVGSADIGFDSKNLEMVENFRV